MKVDVDVLGHSMAKVGEGNQDEEAKEWTQQQHWIVTSGVSVLQ